MRRRTTYAVLSGVLLVLGVLAVVAGALLALTFGPNGELQSARTKIDGKGAAVVAEQISVEASNIPVPDGVGTFRIEVSPVGPRALFVGTAQQAPLDGYLTGVPYDVVTSLESGGQAELRQVPGTKLPPPPQQLAFWTAQQTGTPGGTVSLSADLDPGTSLVIMNATPSDGVVADVRVTLTVGWAWRTALGLLVGGALAVVIAIVLAWRSRVAGRRARAGMPERGQPAPGEALAASILPRGDGAGGAHPVVPPPAAIPTPPAIPEDGTADPTEVLPRIEPGSRTPGSSTGDARDT